MAADYLRTPKTSANYGSSESEVLKLVLDANSGALRRLKILGFGHWRKQSKRPCVSSAMP